MRLETAARLLLATAALTGCSKQRPPKTTPRGPEAREAILLTKNVASGRHCTVVDADIALPGIETVLDTAAMPDYLKQSGVAPDSGYALYSLRFDATGKPVRARLIEATIAPELVTPLQQAIASALLDRPAGQPLAARLRVDFTPGASYRLGKSEYCEPEAIPRTESRTETVTTTVAVPSGSVPPRLSLPVSRIKYEVEISPAGIPTAINFLSAVDASRQESMREYLLKQRWKPALDDALPVESRFTTATTGVATLRTTP